MDGSLARLRPAACAQLADLFKHSVPVEEFAAIGLFDPAPQLGPQLLEGGVPGLLASFEQPQPFANDLACGLRRSTPRRRRDG